MQRPQPIAIPSGTGSSFLDDGRFYSLYPHGGCLHSALYRVLPAGRNFFHILEVPSGRIKGFRRGHNQACELARQLEASLYATHG
ncbi:hypothetical protein RGV33_14230 [Pseudomonas sp. Bout1]|uniref:hypothetical protein n=1 Tax=Pseudomonas sp. Bout1 TaxID=3048600 RepID=UPI002AB33F64|nr:hypothetical protein [Pseudomonas sp. Bout1]MDY7532823.1 hypothetical protein [Pseudomonas sp. Bout1]MEB0189322.1 hypothetical protein [Pseudomonas sp. Bout1]